jgi:prepilin-type N-terminal cleavage/methylation domain-containing protein
MRRSEQGFTMIELVIAMSLSVVLGLAAFGLMQNASSQVSHNSERTSAQQEGRLAAERIVNELHSGCLGPTVTPVWIAPSATIIGPNRLRFVATEYESPRTTSALPSGVPNPRLYEYEYSESGHKLTEKQYKKTGGQQPNWSFSSTAAVSRTLLEHVFRATVKKNEGKETEEVPVFRYYRYYTTAEGESLRGLIRPTEMSSEELTKEGKEEEEAASAGEGRGNEVAEVKVAFLAQPRWKGAEATSTNLKLADLGTPISETAVFRVDPSSTTNTTLDAPCT